MTQRLAALLAAIVIAYMTTAGVLIWRSSAVVDGERYFSLSDDPMISMRYAKNLVAGHGPVWNVDEPRIEGYTNPGWMLLMAAVHELPLPLSKMSAVVLAIELLLLVANLFVIGRLTLACGGDPATGVAASFLTAAFWPLTGWSLAGFETSILAVFLGAALIGAIHMRERRQFQSAPYWILGAATLVRLDAAVFAAAVLLALLFADRASRTKHILIGGGIIAAFVIAQTGLRYAYYGDWLPNTYYLKMTGYPLSWRVMWGARSLLGFAWREHWWLLLPAVVAVSGRNFGTALLAVTIAFQFAYAAYAGTSDTRFTTTVMPLALVLCALGLRDLQRISDRRRERLKPVAYRARKSLSGLAYAAAIVVVAIGLGGFDLSGFSDPSDQVTPLIEHVHALEALTTPTASVAVVAAGGLPYFLDRPAVDLLGKNDRTVAREAAHASFRSFSARYVPGHVKWDYAYSLGQLKPDVIVDLWKSPDEARPYLSAYQAVVIDDRMTYLRKDSARIRWDRFPEFEVRSK